MKAAGVAAVAILATTVGAAGQNRAAVIASIDSILGGPISRGQVAGASIAVVKGRDTILIKGYGFGDLELEAPTPPDAIYEIGSITKQFTAAAILQLVEQGKLSLDDDLTKYLPSYPTKGHRISIRRLLDHTSGIKGYTEMREATRLFPLNLPKDSIVALFSAAPFDFAPGEALVYNNSGYFLLGLIIEKVAGLPYSDYIQKNLFDKAGMPSSRYCSETVITKRKVRGYGYSPNGLVKAAQQVHAWPYAAGSICASAGDLIAWLRALHTSDRVVSRASYREMITPGTLNDGTPVRYAKGLLVAEEDGRTFISHGGGISGFVTDSRYYPADDLYIVVLYNTAGPGSPAEAARGIAQVLLGPGPPPKREPFTGNLAELAGSYRGVGRGVPLQVTLSVESDTLKVRAGNAPAARPLRYLGNDTFEGTARDRFTIIRESGKVTAIRADLGIVVSRLARGG
jgi:CubicO group peptidase (beta-lactamase class C family)